MEILGALFLSKGINDNYKDGYPVILPTLLALIFYNNLEKYLVKNYSVYMLEMFIGFILMSVLIYRFSFMVYQSHITRWGVYWILKSINIVLCITLSIVFFNYIGGTPFTYLIDKFNISGLIYLIFKFLDYMIKILFFYKIHECIIFILKKIKN